MLERARSQTTSVVNDPLDDAKQWGITIWTVEKVFNFTFCISCYLPPLLLQVFAWLEQVKEQLVELKKKVKVAPLKEPYIKFETFDR